MNRKLIFLAVLVCLLVLGVVGCDMENTGYQVEYYEITESTYNNRISGTPDEQLNYVKGESGTGTKGTYWSSSEQGLREFFAETLNLSASDINKVITGINSNRVSGWWVYPSYGVGDYFFLYVENNEL